jgi:photosystem II stability/assembly factor-like uncharacterized protein
VPTGFTAGSVTFVSPTDGWVLGTAPCSSPPCTSVLRTSDSGAHWVGIPAPRAPGGIAPSAADGVRSIRFATPQIGYAFGPGLYQTTDGGRHWSHVASIDGRTSFYVESLEAADGVVYATVAAAGRGGPTGPVHIDRATAGKALHSLTTVPETAGFRLITAGGFAVLPAQTQMITVSPTGAISRHRLPDRACAVAASFVSDLLAVCGEGAGGGSMGTRTAYGSTDGGASWKRLPDPGRGSGYDGDDLAVTTGGFAAVATQSAAESGLLTTTNYAERWRTTLNFRNNAGSGFVDLGYENSSDGVVIYAPWIQPTARQRHQGAPARGRLYRTTDGGQSWKLISF